VAYITTLAASFSGQKRQMNHRRLELSIWQRIWHHWPTITFGTIGLLMFYISTIHPPNPTPATMSPKSIIIFGLVLIGLSIATFVWLESKLNLEKIEIKFDNQTAIRIILDTAKRNDWFVDSKPPLTTKRIELTKLNSVGATPNEIVVELVDNFVFVNARGNYPTDKKIIKKLRTALTEYRA
jgi:hypothetical protein